MVEMKQLLVLRLEGALQSWGDNAKWDFRDSGTIPTKSGIVGLLGCAMGEERNSPVLAELAQAMTVAVRADRPGVKFVDFQTVQGNPLRTADGGKRNNNTFISPHAYLQDACFTVFVDTTEEWRQRIVSALEAPKWCMYLGRKNCVPSRPIQAKLFACKNMKAALEQYPPAERAEKIMTYESEIADSATASLLRSDDLVGKGRQFGLRRVWRGTVEPRGGAECT